MTSTYEHKDGYGKWQFRRGSNPTPDKIPKGLGISSLALGHEIVNKHISPATSERYPSDGDRRARLKPKVFFRLVRLRDFWGRYNDGRNFSMSDAVILLLDFYDQFYERCKDDFKRQKVEAE